MSETACAFSSVRTAPQSWTEALQRGAHMADNGQPTHLSHAHSDVAPPVRRREHALRYNDVPKASGQPISIILCAICYACYKKYKTVKTKKEDDASAREYQTDYDTWRRRKFSEDGVLCEKSCSKSVDGCD